MGKFQRQFDITVPFDGDQIIATVKAGTTQQVFSLDDSSEAKLVEAFASRLSEAIVNLVGPFDAAGTQVDKAEFLSVSYFSAAVMQLGTEWLTRSVPRKAEKAAA